MTPFGPYELFVRPSDAADDRGIVTFDERVNVVGSNVARGRPRLLNCTRFAALGAACCTAGIGFPTVKVRGRLPIEMLLSSPEGFGIATYQEQSDLLPSGSRS